MSQYDVFKQRWFVITNDLIGGAAIGNVDKPASKYSFLHGSTDYLIADMLTWDVAEYIVNLHNKSICPRCYGRGVERDLVCVDGVTPEYPQETERRCKCVSG